MAAPARTRPGASIRGSKEWEGYEVRFADESLGDSWASFAERDGRSASDFLADLAGLRAARGTDGWECTYLLMELSFLVEPPRVTNC
jgi:hypothetical protein